MHEFKNDLPIHLFILITLKYFTSEKHNFIYSLFIFSIHS